MKMLLYLLPLLVVIVAVCVLIIVRARARTWADQVIYGKRTTTVTEINKNIGIILTINTLLIYRTDQDQQRLQGLRDIRNKKLTSHE